MKISRWPQRMVQLAIVPLLLLVLLSAPAPAQQPSSGSQLGIHCGGWGHAAVTVIVGDSSANAGGQITVGSGDALGPLGDWSHAVQARLGRDPGVSCATTVGSTTVEAPSPDHLSLRIRAKAPLEVVVRAKGGAELARMSYTPGKPDSVLTWPPRG
jgi:hypothetical protein